jgi:hypothetical protein
MFAAKGITGKSQEEVAARALIRRSYHEDGVICAVISKDDIDAMVGAQTTFFQLVYRRYEEFRFGKSRGGESAGSKTGTDNAAGE